MAPVYADRVPDDDPQSEARAAAEQEFHASQVALQDAQLRHRDAQVALEKILRGDR